MNYLYAALDESNDGYCALIVGDKAAIDRQGCKIPPSFNHMASWHGDDNEKKRIVRSLDFEGNILPACVKFGLKELRIKIQDVVNSGKCRMPSTKINNIIGYEIARTVDKLYGKFAVNNHFQVRNLTFVVDNLEMINYLKNGHNAVLKYGKIIDAHTIADCIAYSQMGNESKGYRTRQRF